MTDTNNVADTAAPMRLRADPPKVTRLSRKVLAGFGLIASLAVAGALFYALQPRDSGPGGNELYSVENRPTAEGLTGLPSDYTGPILGPPLPGDLGRPILDAQNRGQPVVPPVITAPAIDPDEQRRLAEEEAERLRNIPPIDYAAIARQVRYNHDMFTVYLRTVFLYLTMSIATVSVHRNWSYHGGWMISPVL